MLTSSFFDYRGPGRISIARFAPRRIPGGFRVARELAPGPWFNSVPALEYVARYQAEILARLDPALTWARLHELAHPHEPVLLCWERAPFSAPDRWWDLADADTRNLCHRRQVAVWLADSLGVEIPEYDPGKASVETGPLVQPELDYRSSIG